MPVLTGAVFRVQVATFSGSLNELGEFQVWSRRKEKSWKSRLIYLVTEFSIFPAIINVTILFSLFECRKFAWKSWGKSSGEVLELVLSGKWDPFLQQLPRPAASSPLHCWQLFRLLALRCGTACHWRLCRHCLWRPSALNLRRFYLLSHFLIFDSFDIYSTHCGLSSVLNT